MQLIRIIICLILRAGALRDAVADTEDRNLLARRDFLCAGILPLGKHVLLHQSVGNDLAGFCLGGECTDANYEGVAALECGACRSVFGHTELTRKRERIAPHEVAAAVVLVCIAHGAQHQREKFRLADCRICVKIDAPRGVLLACNQIIGNSIADIGVCPCGHVVKRRLCRLGFGCLLDAEIAFEQDDCLCTGQVVGKTEAVPGAAVSLHQSECIQAVGSIRLRRCGGNQKRQ